MDLEQKTTMVFVALCAYIVNMLYYNCRAYKTCLNITDFKNKALSELEKKTNMVKAEVGQMVKLEDYLNEQGLNLLNDKRKKVCAAEEQLNQKKSEIEPEMNKLKFNSDMFMVKGLLTYPGYYIIGYGIKAVSGVYKLMKKAQKKSFFNAI